MLQSHLRFASNVFKGDCDQHLEREVFAQSVVGTGNHVAVGVSERVCVNQPLRRNDFAIDSGGPIILPLGAAHAIEIFATDAQIDFGGRRRKIFWPPPLYELFRVGPRLPYKFARRVEDARDYEFRLCRLSGGTFSLFVHVSSPSFAFAVVVSALLEVRAGERRGDRSSRPRTCGSVRANLRFPLAGPLPAGWAATAPRGRARLDRRVPTLSDVWRLPAGSSEKAQPALSPTFRRRLAAPGS